MEIANSDKLTIRELVFAHVLFTIVCILGIIITMEVVTINDERRLDEMLIQIHEAKRKQELHDMAAARCFAAAQAQGLDFVKVCPDWVYEN